MEGVRATGGDRLPRLLWATCLTGLLLLTGSAIHLLLTVTGTPPVEEDAHRLAVRRAGLVGTALHRVATDDAALRRVAAADATEPSQVAGSEPSPPGHVAGSAAAAFGRVAGQLAGVEVLRVDGSDHRRSPGVRLVFRVHVGLSRRTMTGPVQTDRYVCFRQVIDVPARDFSRTEVTCPATAAPDGAGIPPGSPIAIPGTTPAE